MGCFKKGGLYKRGIEKRGFVQKGCRSKGELYKWDCSCQDVPGPPVYLGDVLAVPPGLDHEGQHARLVGVAAPDDDDDDDDYNDDDNDDDDEDDDEDGDDDNDYIVPCGAGWLFWQALYMQSPGQWSKDQDDDDDDDDDDDVVIINIFFSPCA